jgi:hypothetical protein
MGWCCGWGGAWEDCERDPQDARFVSFNTFILVTISTNFEAVERDLKSLRKRLPLPRHLLCAFRHLPSARTRHRQHSPLSRVHLHIRISTVPPHDEDGSAWCVLNSGRIPPIASNNHIDDLVIFRYDLGGPGLYNSAC